MRSLSTALRLATSASVVALCAMPSTASAATCNWTTAAGIWNNLTNWSCAAIPGGGDVVTINTPGSIVTLTGAIGQASTLSLGSGNIINVSGTDLLITGGTLTNNGTITFGANSRFRASGTLNIGGNGTIVLDTSSGYARIGEFGGNFIFGSGQTVRGTGELGFNSASFTNNGLVSADVSGGTLVVDTAGGNGTTSFVNTGIMQATGGGILRFDGGGYDNTGAVIRATNNGTVVLNGDARIIGGSLTNNTGGALTTAGTSYLQNTTITGGSTLTMGNNSDILVNNALTVNGTLNITAGANRLRAETGSVLIGGTGDVLLGDTVSYSRIGEFGGNFTFGSGLTVHGSGNVGFNSASFTNNGLISADVSGRTLVLDTVGGNGTTSFINAGTLQATGGGTLYFDGGGYDNTGQVIRAVSSGIVTLASDSRIIGGSLTTNTGGVMNTGGGSQFLQNTTLTGGSTLTMGDNSDILVNGALTVNGTLAMTGVGTRLRAESAGAVTINGTGDVLMVNNFYSRIGEYGGDFTFGSGLTVHGNGNVGFNSASFTNNGLISADTNGATLVIDTVGGNGTTSFINAGTLQATGGGTLYIAGGAYSNAGQVIRSINSGIVTLGSDSRIIGGSLTTNTGGVMNTESGAEFLQNTTITSGSTLTMGSNSDVLVNGALTVNGTLAMTGVGTRLRAESAGAVTINGTGDVLMVNNFYSRIGEYGGDFTFGSGLTVHGNGNVGFNSASFTNNGLISADTNGAMLVLDTVGGNGTTSFTNAGTLQATSGGTLYFDGGGYDNTGHVIRAINGGIVTLGSDSRIIGGSLTTNTGGVMNTLGSNYLQNATITTGSALALGLNSDVFVNGVLTVNGTLAMTAGANRFRAESGAVTINGAGDVLMSTASGYSRIGEFGGNFTFGSGLTVHGSGEVGFNSSVITNNGLISADGGTGLSLDVAGGSGGTGGGLGTGGISGLLNFGTVQAANGNTLSVQGGRYENTATGTFGAIGAGSQFVMNSDANLTNLQGGGVLSLGNYISSTTGAASTLSVRGTGANSISTIGTGAAGQDTVVTLSGINSVFNVLDFSTGTATAIDSTLTNVAHSGALQLLNNRSMTITAGGGAFSNAGFVQLGGGTFGASSFTNSGAVDGFGSITTNIANTGSVTATGGTLATRTITGTTGTIMSNAGGIIDFSAGASNSTAGSLVLNGGMGLGTRNITVTSDYFNAAFGSGNAFNNHANVTGSGLILAANATMDLTGTALSGNVLNVGNVRTGGSSSTILTITNNGTLTDIVGAVQNTNAPSIALSVADFALNAGGGSVNVGISYAGMTAGSLAGQTLKVVNNFDNVASQTLTLQGNVYQAAQAGAQPGSVALGARRVGDAASTSVLTISNVAPITPGFNETLTANASVGGGFLLNGAGTASVSNLGAGNSSPLTLSHVTTVAGAFSSAVAITNTSNAVAGSGLANLALAGQSITVTNNVYAAAVANVSGNSVNFGTVRKGATSPTASIGVTNGAAGALTDSLVTTAGAMPAGVTATAPGSLASGQSGNANFSLNTATAGVVSGSGSLNFASHNSEMADAALASQTISFVGTVTDLANGSLFKNSGTGTFSGSGNVFTLNLGTLTANSGIFGSDLGVANTITNSAFAETLGGSFAFSATTGYSFAGNSFAGLAGGSQNIGNLLSFDTAGLSNGTYNQTITFNGFSRFTGLNDQSLSPITLNISATISGAGGGNPDPNPNPGAVPEPATWMMMLSGFAFVGGMMRRKNRGRTVATA